MQWQVVSLLCWLNCFYPLFLSSCKTRLMPLLRCQLYYLSVNCLFFYIRPNLLPSDAFLLLFVVSDSEYETKQTRQTLEMILWYAYFFWAEKKKILGPANPILKTRGRQGEFHLLVKELRNYTRHFQVCFRMSVVQVDSLLATLEQHVKRKTTNFCKLVHP